MIDTHRHGVYIERQRRYIWMPSQFHRDWLGCVYVGWVRQTDPEEDDERGEDED